MSTVALDTGRVIQIYYLFGRLSTRQDLAALPGFSGTSRYVLVQEILGIVVPTQEQLTRTHPGGSWVFTTAIPARDLSLIVTSNGPRALVRQLGTRLVANTVQTMSCALNSYGAIQTCYAPRDVAQAEHQLPVSPVDPSGAVWSATYLRLKSVIVREQSLHPANVVGIVYIFGTIPASGGGSIPSPAPSHPQFVVVTETATAHPSGPWRVARTIGHLANGKPRYDPWNFYARNLDVVGNVSKQSIRGIGLQILRQTTKRD